MANWKTHKHPLGPAWASEDARHLILHLGSRVYLLFQVGQKESRRFETWAAAQAAAQ